MSQALKLIRSGRQMPVSARMPQALRILAQKAGMQASQPVDTGLQLLRIRLLDAPRKPRRIQIFSTRFAICERR